MKIYKKFIVFSGHAFLSSFKLNNVKMIFLLAATSTGGKVQDMIILDAVSTAYWQINFIRYLFLLVSFFTCYLCGDKKLEALLVKKITHWAGDVAQW